jgi:Copper transport outer membrane protein, MctB
VFDLRYHVASLAAVFFALIIGILVGVALASHGLGDTERDRLEEDLRRAQVRGDALEAQLDAREVSGASEHAFVEKSYRVVIANRLKGARIAVLFVGSVNDDALQAITVALRDADSGTPLRIRAVQVPINRAAMAQRLANRPFLAAYAAKDQLEELGHALGQEFTAGAETPLWNALESLIVEQKDGSAKQPADGIIVVRTVPAQIGATALFLKGLYSGLKDVGVPAVGVDVREGDGSAIKAFKKAGLSTVDDVDTAVGKLALVILLSEPAVTGDYGTKTTADDGPLPNVVPVPTTTGG